MTEEIGPQEALVSIVVNALNLRGYDTVMLLAPNNEPAPTAMDLTEFVYWLRDAVVDLDAVTGVMP